ncbi:hypothetical protein MRX96_036948 [Rhipicephalus microplus]
MDARLPCLPTEYRPHIYERRASVPQQAAEAKCDASRNHGVTEEEAEGATDAATICCRLHVRVPDGTARHASTGSGAQQPRADGTPVELGVTQDPATAATASLYNFVSCFMLVSRFVELSVAGRAGINFF